MNKDEIYGAVEAILFASGTPVAVDRIAKALGGNLLISIQLPDAS